MKSVTLKSINTPYNGESCEFTFVNHAGEHLTIEGQYCAVPSDDDSSNYDIDCFPLKGNEWSIDVTLLNSPSCISASDLMQACRLILAHYEPVIVPVASLTDDNFKTEIFNESGTDTFCFVATSLDGGDKGQPIEVTRETGLSLSQAIKSVALSWSAEFDGIETLNFDAIKRSVIAV